MSQPQTAEKETRQRAYLEGWNTAHADIAAGRGKLSDATPNPYGNIGHVLRVSWDKGYSDRRGKGLAIALPKWFEELPVEHHPEVTPVKAESDPAKNAPVQTEGSNT